MGPDDLARGPAAAGEGRPSPVIRARTGRDLDGCVRLLAEVHQREGYPVTWPDRPAAWLAGCHELAGWVATRDGRLVGHASLRRGGAGDADGTALVSRLFVAPPARGLGTGAALLRRVTLEARTRGLCLVLDVVATSAAVAFYADQGWRLSGSWDEQWGPHRVTLRRYAAPG